MDPVVAGSSPVDRPLFYFNMTWIEAFILGLVQGATEFFPISSSAHLKLAKLLLGITASEENSKLFDLFCHLGTLSALFFVFRKDISALFFTERKKLFDFFLALLPLIPGYLILHPFLNGISAPKYLGFFLLITGGILFLGHFFQLKVSEKKRPFRDVLCIGGAQTLALIPGLSRSASTISCARILGWTPKDAVRFSFLLSIPTIIGGSGLEAFRLFYFDLPFGHSAAQCCIGFFSSFIIGMVMIRFSLLWLEKGDLKPFAWYCLFIGTLTLFYFNFHA